MTPPSIKIKVTITPSSKPLVFDTPCQVQVYSSKSRLPQMLGVEERRVAPDHPQDLWNFTGNREPVTVQVASGTINSILR